MDRQTELALVDELLALKAQKAPFLDQNIARNAVSHYTSHDRFDAEQDKIFRALPAAAAQTSELAEPGAFVRRIVGGRGVLLTRDKAGGVHAFLNVCRHRGTRLVDEPSGCKHKFSCPYHAWTYANTGELIAAPHFDAGFTGVDKADLGLTRLPCAERFGLIFVVATPDATMDLDGYFEGLEDDLTALGLADMTIAADETQTRRANWKLLVEGGIEAYHFRVAHRATIGPYFEDNLSTYRAFGPHLRSILPRTSMASLRETDRQTWRLRDHANVLYSLFPNTQLLVQQDHVVWINQRPIAPGETQVRMATLVPQTAATPQRDTDHWRRNHAITITTLDEDFAIGESIQDSAQSGANADMVFGRFEGALGAFNRTIDRALAGDL